MPRPSEEPHGGWGYTQGQYQPPAPQPPDPETLNQLKRIGSNLNQLARSANSGPPPNAKHTMGEVQRFLSFFTSKFRKPSGDDSESDERS